MNKILWTIHEEVQNSVDLFLRGNFLVSQVRQFSLAEKIRIKSKRFQNTQHSLIKNSANLNDHLTLEKKKIGFQLIN